jgi:hypothetical protein
VTRRIVVISDTHGLHHELGPLPRGSILVHCGDILIEDRGLADGGGVAALARLEAFGLWLASQPFEHAIVVGGNHDRLLEEMGRDEVRAALGRRPAGGAADAERCTVHYLHDETAVIDGLRIHGTALSLANGPAGQNRAFQPAFGAGREDTTLARALDALPTEPARLLLTRVSPAPELSWPCCALTPPSVIRQVDILVSHGPPAGVLDDGRGCVPLADYVRLSPPGMHLFGHQHLCYGAAYDATLGTLFVNASNCDGFFAPLHPPVVVDSPPRAHRVNNRRPGAAGGWQCAVQGKAASKLVRSTRTLNLERARWSGFALS